MKRASSGGVESVPATQYKLHAVFYAFHARLTSQLDGILVSRILQFKKTIHVCETLMPPPPLDMHYRVHKNICREGIGTKETVKRAVVYWKRPIRFAIGEYKMVIISGVFHISILPHITKCDKVKSRN
jgi:hypothetical protein